MLKTSEMIKTFVILSFSIPLYFLQVGCALDYTATQEDVDLGIADEIGQTLKLKYRRDRYTYLKSPDYAYEQQMQALAKSRDAKEITDAQYRLMANQAKMNRDVLNNQANQKNNTGNYIDFNQNLHLIK
jgi:hypothetical protein